jgi:hypothetical protein
MTSSGLALSIGGVVGYIELVDAPAMFLAQVRARYGAFAMPAAPGVIRDFTLRLELVSAEDPKRAVDRRPWDTSPLEVSASGRAIEIDRWDISVRLAARSRRGPFRGEGRCEMNPFSIDCILRVIWAALLPRVGGMLVHGCGLRHAEAGYVFPGPSGAGKTTLARKVPDPDDVLSDELCALRRTDDGWRVHGTPFWGDFERGGISMRGWPLRTLAFLAQAPDDAVTVTPVTAAEASLRLLGCFLAFAYDRTTVEENLALAVRLCAEVRSVEASVTKRVPADEILREIVPHLGPEQRTPAAAARETISELRAVLRKHGKYASQSKGSSMSPWLRPGDVLFIRAVDESALDVGDILLYWSPGPRPEDDLLVCHRLVRRSPRGGAITYVTKGDANSRFERFENGRRYEILGKVVAVARDGTTRSVPGRLGSLARLFGSLAAAPLLRLAGR